MFEIRRTRTVAQGRRKLTREREEYFRLVQQGVSYAEAAKAVGINLRTGKRWRNGRNPSGGRRRQHRPDRFCRLLVRPGTCGKPTGST
ncbi:helix-turn-helix domain-containing protein [Streptomyces sp. B21-102]|uniref:helix-turn-helix domain-containing protein n=1 Tax=Streptomyces sp. B21-102 TaxID=3039416 RepID=UPI003FA6C77C